MLHDDYNNNIKKTDIISIDADGLIIAPVLFKSNCSNVRTTHNCMRPLRVSSWKRRRGDEVYCSGGGSDCAWEGVVVWRPMCGGDGGGGGGGSGISQVEKKRVFRGYIL